MNIDEIQAMAVSVGFPDPETAAAVAMAESRGNPSATNIVTNPAPGNGPERSFGLWQINTLAHPNYNEQSLLNPTYNARAALDISQNGTNWTPWSTYNKGFYKKYLTSSGKLTLTPKVTAAIAIGIVGTAAVAAFLLTPELFRAPARALAFENPAESEKRSSVRVQSLMFPRDKWTKEEARAWLKEHGYKSKRVDETDTYWHFRQESPDNFEIIRSKPFGEAIMARVGR
jgi:hypothetical protein